jgi:hypothetical protein
LARATCESPNRASKSMSYDGKALLSGATNHRPSLFLHCL